MANTDLDGAEPNNATGIDAAGVGASKVLDEVRVYSTLCRSDFNAMRLISQIYSALGYVQEKDNSIFQVALKNHLTEAFRHKHLKDNAFEIMMHEPFGSINHRAAYDSYIEHNEMYLKYRKNAESAAVILYKIGLENKQIEKYNRFVDLKYDIGSETLERAEDLSTFIGGAGLGIKGIRELFEIVFTRAIGKGSNFAERLFLSESFGITSKRFGSSLVKSQGSLNVPGRLFKMGWSNVSKNGGGMQLRIGIGRKLANRNQALFHIYFPKTFVPNSFSNPSMQLKLSLHKLGL